MTYKVFFEIYGRKFKTTVEARSEKLAQSQVRDAIVFYKVQLVNEEPPDFLKDLFGTKDNWPFC